MKLTKLFIIYDILEFISNKSGYDDYHFFTKKNGQKIFTFSDLEFAFSKQFYYLQNVDKFEYFLEKYAFDSKKIKEIKNLNLKIKKQLLTQVFNSLKQRGKKNKIIICDYATYCEIVNTCFDKEKKVN